MNFLLTASVLAFVSSSLLLGYQCLPIYQEDDPMLIGGDIEGDILLDVNSKGLSQDPTRYRVRWTNNTIPYVLSSEYTTTNKNMLRDAMTKLENLVANPTTKAKCVRFVPKTASHKNWLSIESGTGCSSYVGMSASAGSQRVSLMKNGCLYTGTIQHELIHALGFTHEQNRPDRDNFLTINFANIKESAMSNFLKRTSGWSTLGFPYDYTSVMHYDGKAFSANGLPTMVPKQSGVTLLHSSRKTLSKTDIAEIRKYYSCA